MAETTLKCSGNVLRIFHTHNIARNNATSETVSDNFSYQKPECDDAVGFSFVSVLLK